jgi:hypothetical protein
MVRASGGKAVTSGGLPRRQSPFRTDTAEGRQIDAVRRILLEVAPLHGRTKDRTQHIVNLIDGLGRVPRLREMSHVCLDLLSRHIADRPVAELRQQVLLQHEPTMLLRRVFVHRQFKKEGAVGTAPHGKTRSGDVVRRSARTSELARSSAA